MVEALGLTDISLEQRIYQMMLDAHVNDIKAEIKKEAQAKAEIEKSGKTKLTWDKDVKAKDYLWSIDVLSNTYKLDRPSVVETFKQLEAKGLVKCFMINSKASQCFFIPAEHVVNYYEEGGSDERN